jgi:hypothetical protein
MTTLKGLQESKGLSVIEAGHACDERGSRSSLLFSICHHERSSEGQGLASPFDFSSRAQRGICFRRNNDRLGEFDRHPGTLITRIRDLRPCCGTLLSLDFPTEDEGELSS